MVKSESKVNTTLCACNSVSRTKHASAKLIGTFLYRRIIAARIAGSFAAWKSIFNALAKIKSSTLAGSNPPCAKRKAVSESTASTVYIGAGNVCIISCTRAWC